MRPASCCRTVRGSWTSCTRRWSRTCRWDEAGVLEEPALLVLQRAGVWGSALWDEGVKCPTQHPSHGWEDRQTSPPGVTLWHASRHWVRYPPGCVRPWARTPCWIQG